LPRLGKKNMAEFRAKIAGRFYAEFYFYLVVFIVTLYLALQPSRNPWLVVLAVVSTLFFFEMIFLMARNLRKAEKAFVRVDAKKIVVADDEGSKTIKWADVDRIMIAWFSKDKWLERFFGLNPSILMKLKGEPTGEAELGIAPDFFKTPQILAEMQKLHPKKIYFA